jgi:hypothetical protein
MSQKIQDIRTIKREDIEKLRNEERRAELGMLKILLKRYYPEKLKLVFPEKYVIKSGL